LRGLKLRIVRPISLEVDSKAGASIHFITFDFGCSDGRCQEAGLEVSTLARLAHPLRVLLVDDDAIIRKALNKLLEALGHRAHVTQNVREALEFALSENETFDLLLSDISLPDGNGWELLRCLTDGGRRPWRAIAMSGQSSMEDLAKSQTAGFEQHLLKPVAPAIVEAILREAAEEVPR